MTRIDQNWLEIDPKYANLQWKLVKNKIGEKIDQISKFWKLIENKKNGQI